MRAGCTKNNHQPKRQFSSSPPVFLLVGTGRVPLPVADLEAAWVDGADVLYFGKATSLRKPLAQYRRSGTGRTSTHQGGRSIWQLADAGALLVAWMPTPGQPPADVESHLLAEFAASTGALPFANRRR